jgi:hypothetical protein
VDVNTFFFGYLTPRGVIVITILIIIRIIIMPTSNKVVLSSDICAMLMTRVSDACLAFVNLAHTNRAMWHLSKHPGFLVIWRQLNCTITRPIPNDHHLGARLRVIRYVSFYRLECDRCHAREAKPLRNIGMRLCDRCCEAYLLPVDQYVPPHASVRFEWRWSSHRHGSKRVRFATPEDLLKALESTG